MLIVALVLAVIGLGALVLAVVTSNEMIAWVCIAASLVGVILLIVDAIRDRSNRNAGESDSGTTDSGEDSGEDEIDYEDYPDEAPVVEEYDETPGETPGEDTVDVDVATGDDGRTGENPVDGDPPRN